MIKEAVKIGNIVKEALRLAEFYNHIEDSGAANFDSCIVEFDNTNKTFIEIVNEISGGNLIVYKKPQYRITIADGSQGLKRTKKAEVVCEYLKKNGINAKVEYNID